ncbi:uncharacterized protein LOC128681855 [Plodia interpunctella]|uniref:uncharacterized protein LOC128681855 n=1 Tax=Plodia interpunctella TaxID=58824 RepID=UPI0023676694|nr:uncharacterized protein LOC128681855 [Plodia interpunctella]
MMKAGVLVLLCLYCSVECRKTYTPVDKNANLAFINMEGGGGTRPPVNQPQQPPSSPAKPPSPTNVQPRPVSPTQPPVKPIVTVVAPTPAPTPKPTPAVKPQVKPQANPTPLTTPGPGTVKQLVNFYDSQGKGSPIRPYSYSQAVKQG